LVLESSRQRQHRRLICPTVQHPVHTHTQLARDHCLIPPSKILHDSLQLLCQSLYTTSPDGGSRDSRRLDREAMPANGWVSELSHRNAEPPIQSCAARLTAIVINAARMKLRQRLPQAQLCLAEGHGEQNLLLAGILPDHKPNAERVCCRRELAERLADGTT